MNAQHNVAKVFFRPNFWNRNLSPEPGNAPTFFVPQGLKQAIKAKPQWLKNYTLLLQVCFPISWPFTLRTLPSHPISLSPSTYQIAPPPCSPVASFLNNSLPCNTPNLCPPAYHNQPLSLLHRLQSKCSSPSRVSACHATPPSRRDPPYKAKVHFNTQSVQDVNISSSSANINIGTNCPIGPVSLSSTSSVGPNYLFLTPANSWGLTNRILLSKTTDIPATLMPSVALYCHFYLCHQIRSYLFFHVDHLQHSRSWVRSLSSSLLPQYVGPHLRDPVLCKQAIQNWHCELIFFLTTSPSFHLPCCHLHSCWQLQRFSLNRGIMLQRIKLNKKTWHHFPLTWLTLSSLPEPL